MLSSKIKPLGLALQLSLNSPLVFDSISRLSERGEALDSQLGLLPLPVGTKDVLERLCRQEVASELHGGIEGEDNDRCIIHIEDHQRSNTDLFSSELLVRVLQKLQRQLLLPEKDSIGIIDLGAHLLAELVQLLLADDSRVAKPSPVRLDAGRGQFLGLEVLGQRVAGFFSVPAPPRGSIRAMQDRLILQLTSWITLPLLSRTALFLYMARRRTWEGKSRAEYEMLAFRIIA